MWYRGSGFVATYVKLYTTINSKKNKKRRGTGAVSRWVQEKTEYIGIWKEYQVSNSDAKKNSICEFQQVANYILIEKMEENICE